jgi:hypothetical protein
MLRERRGEVNADMDVTRATAYLPGLDIEIVHAHVIEGINIRLATSVFGRGPQADNPLALFALSARRWTLALRRRENEGASSSARKHCALGLLPAGGALHANRCKDQ